MSSAAAMSLLTNTSTVSFSAFTLEVLRNFVNTSSIAYEGTVSVIKENFAAVELLSLFQSVVPTSSEFSLLVTAGFACFLTTAGIWSICKAHKQIYSEEADVKDSKLKLLQLIKKAYLPGVTETVIEQLNQLDFDVNEKVSAEGLTFFLCGCLSGMEALIKHMIKMGADVNSETSEGDSALYLATFAVLHSVEPSISALRVLIKAGINVNKQNKRGYTPLHRAASKGNLKVIQYLLLEGADPYLANSVGVYPIDSAVCAGHLKAASLLKLKIPSPYVWNVLEPHTPPHIKMGLQSPPRHNLLLSNRRTNLRNVFT